MLGPIAQLLQRWQEVRFRSKKDRVTRIVYSENVTVTRSPCDPHCIIVAAREPEVVEFHTPRMMGPPALELPGVYWDSPRPCEPAAFRAAYYRLPVVSEP